MEAMEEDHPSDLNHGQLFFFDLCQNDLNASSKQYRLTGRPHHGQQVLADLRRMQNIIHRHLLIPGDYKPPLANVYVISQVLTTILLNPDGQNLCYGNAPFRCWCWTGAFAEDSAKAWGYTQHAVRRCLTESQAISLAQDPDLAPLWERFLWAQADCPFFGGRFFDRKAQGTVEVREQFPLNVIFPAGDRPMLLDELISNWADEDGGQFLYGAPDALVIQLQRFQKLSDGWTKHDRPLDFGTEINIPFSEDGHHVHMAAYRIVALVTHQGCDHHTGHYQSLLLMDNAVWLADDGQYRKSHLNTRGKSYSFGLSKNLWTSSWRTLRRLMTNLLPRKRGMAMTPSPSSLATSPISGLRFRIGRGRREMLSSFFMKRVKRPLPELFNTTPTGGGRPMARLHTLLGKEAALVVS